MIARLVEVAAVISLVCCADIASAQPGGGRFESFLGLRSSLLIDIAEVREELSTTDEQNELLDALKSDLADQRGALFGEHGREGPPNTPDARRDWLENLRERLEAFDRRSEQLVGIVLEPQQSARLVELRLQREGARAFRRAEVLKTLELNEEQRKKVADILASTASPQFTPNFNFGQLREQLAKQEADVLATLTDEQRARWDEMKGTPFDFPTPRRRRR